MLENHHAGLVELTHGVPGGLGVEEVVVGQRLALELLGAHERGLRGEERGVGGVETVDRGGLMRVLAVAQVLGLLELDGHRGGSGELAIGGEDRVGATGLGLGGEPGGNGAVIGSRGGVDLHLETAARLERGGAVVGAHLGEDRLVIGRVGNHGHGVGVLGGGAQHGRAADIDVLDGIRKGDVGVGNGLLELIEIHDHHVDHTDAMLGSLGHVLLGIATGQQAAVDLGVQRLDAAVHHLGEPGVLLDGRHGNATVDQSLCRTAGRDDLDAELLLERTGELDHAGLVRHRDQRAGNLPLGSHGPSFAQVGPPHPATPRYIRLYCTAGGGARAARQGPFWITCRENMAFARRI